MAEKANHHFIPQFYLRNFGDGGDPRKAKLFVYDKSTNKTFRTTVRNVGSKRHFNRVDVEGHDPNSIEDAFAEIEGKISRDLSDVIAERSFPSHEHYSSVMNLIAWISLRNPRMRANMEGFHRRIVEAVMGQMLSTKERYEAIGRQMQEAGKEVKDVSYEEVRRFYESKEYDIEIDQTHLIGLELRTLDTILEPLARRKWTFVNALPCEQFITSDEPTALIFSRDDLYGSLISPGHGLRETLLVFPLSPEVAIIGTFEDDLDLLGLKFDTATWVNSIIMWFADRQIYARDHSFRVHASQHLNLKGEDLPLHLAPKKAAKG